ncbi:Quinonprotein alcohol dehydrogenase-like superfamily [Amanita muscaria]
MEAPTIQIGDNPNFSGASAIVIGNHNILRLGDQTLTEQQVKDIIRGAFNVQDVQNKIQQHTLNQEVKNLPRAEAAHDDYQSQKQSEVCFEDTRVIVLEELASWVIDRPKIYALSGPAGIGKSTIAYTFAARAAKLGILGASFFFSRDEPDCRNAKRFFTSIAYQLCVHDKEFAHAIGKTLLTERGTGAVTKNPQEQMQTLILEPLQDIVKSHRQPTVIVIDAIDECDSPDRYQVLASLERLVHGLSSFKVLITTRPQPRLDRLLSSHKVFSLQDIKDETVNSDIRRYLKYNLSREKVDECLPDLRKEWSANDEEIDHLVRMAGGLFIIASTTVRLVLDATIYNPERQMTMLKADGMATLGRLERFYTIILRGAVPEKCESGIIERFKAVVGAILTVQERLPIEVLEHLTNLSACDIDAVLKNLKSVIVVEEDTARIYHKSFFDFLTNEQHVPPDFRIVIKDQNTQIAINCFQIMNKSLKKNILNLGEPACFMDNKDVLKEQEKLVHNNIPLQLRYACMYWAIHTEGANMDDGVLKEGLKQFALKHLLHWLEELSWNCQLFLAHHALRILMPLLESRLPDITKLFSDGLRFISKFYEIIEHSALHIYYSALPFTPTESLLYRTYYEQETTHNKCRVDGGPKQWDALLSRFEHGARVERVAFSQDGSKLLSWSSYDQNVRLWHASAGIPLGTISGDLVAIANSFAVAAKERMVILYDLDSFEPITTLETPALIIQLAVSADGSRIAAGMMNGAVDLWDGKTREFINSIVGYKPYSLAFSRTGSRLAFNSYNNRIKLEDGTSGEHIADLDYRSEELKTTVFSHNDCVLACLAITKHNQYTLTVWNTWNGESIGVARDVGEVFAVSADGSLLATATKAGRGVQLWTMGSSEYDNSLQPLENFGDWGTIDSLAFSQSDTLAIGSWYAVNIYNMKSHSVVATLSYDDLVKSVEFSPDCTRVAAGGRGGILALWDVQTTDTPSIRTSRTGMSEEPVHRVQTTQTIGAIAFSPDCSRLGSGFKDGIAIWDMKYTSQQITSHQGHSQTVTALAFSLDGKQVASGSEDGAVRLWNNNDGTSTRAPLHASSWVHSVAFSSDALAAASNEHIKLWDLRTSNLIGTLDEQGSRLVTFSHGGFLLASFNPSHLYVAVWDVENGTVIAKFTAPGWIGSMLFLSDDSGIAAKLANNDIVLFQVANNGAAGDSTREDIYSLFPIVHWHSIPDLLDQRNHYKFLGRWSRGNLGPTMLWIPGYLDVDTVVQGSTTVVLVCKDGCVIFLQSTDRDTDDDSAWTKSSRKKIFEFKATSAKTPTKRRRKGASPSEGKDSNSDKRRHVETREGTRVEVGTSGRAGDD